MSATKKTDNMELWNKVCVTDPDTTEDVKVRGGFTAIDAQYQIKTATEQWGSYGTTWGVKDLDWCIIYDSSERPVEMVLEAVFWYPAGEFPMAVDRPYAVKDELRKKILTDFTTKALSKLGFNSDVFEGMFDSHPYVANLKREKAKASKPAIKAKPVPKSSAPKHDGIAESDLTDAQRLQRAKDEVRDLAKRVWPDKNGAARVASIQEKAAKLGAPLDSFDGVHAVKAELEREINNG